jgi:peptidoglycan-associated lipoprotein
MKRPFIIIAFIISISLMTGYGCSKKVTKMPGPETTREMPQEPVKAPVRIDSSIFIAENIDSAAKAVLVPVYFDFDKSDIKPSESGKLSNIGPFLAQHAELRVLLEGHCDERGSSEYNIGLGDKRARTVKAWLVNYGISDKRIEVTSYGKEKPAKINCQDDGCNAMNRRVEWKVIK